MHGEELKVKKSGLSQRQSLPSAKSWQDQVNEEQPTMNNAAAAGLDGGDFVSHPHAKKSFKSMFPLWISAGPNNGENGKKVVAGRATPPLPKKPKFDEESIDDITKTALETNGEGEVFETNAKEVLERVDTNKPAPNKTGRATLAPSEGLTFRGLFRDRRAVEHSIPVKDEEQSGNMIRCASSGGSTAASTFSDMHTKSDFLTLNRIAKKEILVVGMRNKLTEVTSSLAAANKKVEELERENDRLVRENRDLKRKLDQSDKRQKKGEESEESDYATNTVKIENLEKGMTSKTLLQVIDTLGDASTVRVVRVPSTGAIHGYCSFKNIVDAHKVMEHFRRSGHLVSCTSEPSTEKKSKRWRN